MMLRVEMLPAGHGDALLVEYRAEPSDRIHRILVDGGPWYAYEKVRQRLLEIPTDEREFELLIVTHVDSDHIDGIIRLLQEPDRPFHFRDIWFNDRRHLEASAPGELAGQQGEYLGALLDRDAWTWNQAVGGGPVTAGDDGPPPTHSLAGGLELTVLSPTPGGLHALLRDWDRAVRKAGFEPGNREEALRQLAERARYEPLQSILGETEDDSTANGSSIAVLARCGGAVVLLAGDAWPSVLQASLDRLPAHHRGVDAFKLSHHGGFGNISQGLIERVRPRQYLVSTNGSYYKHPHDETLKLILLRHGVGKPHLVFNYNSGRTESWLDPQAQAERKYTAELAAGRFVDI